MLALKDTCVHPQTNKPYMKSYGGGKNNSPEGAAVSHTIIYQGCHVNTEQGGLQYGFVSEFESEEDRDYYLNKDPSHLKFVADVKEIVQDARVFDFVPGVL